jgi:dolichol kinase
VQRFERKDILFSGFGSACYATGALIPLVFLSDVNQIAACILILAIGDGLSTLVGKKGRRKLPHNQGKTLEGALAFFIGGLPSVLFIGILGIPLAAIAAIIETIDFRIDDNLTVPIFCTVFFLVIS